MNRPIPLFSHPAALTATLILIGCAETPQSPMDAAYPPIAIARGNPGGSESFATLFTFPSLATGQSSEALAVDPAGRVVAGSAWERRGTLRAVRWTLSANGSWTITSLPLPPSATGAIARGVNDQGDVAGNNFPGSSPHPILWPATGGFTVLGCGELGEVNAVSAGGHIAVGIRRDVAPAAAAIWRPGACGQSLPPLAGGFWSNAHAVNRDGTIIGGSSGGPDGSSLPVRWRLSGGQWQIEQLDSRSGAVRAANSTGDLAGLVQIACAEAGGCQRAVIWYAAAGSRELGTLGGKDSWARGINAAGEVVGLSTSAQGTNTGYFWSAALGMLQLPTKGEWAASNALSEVRPDGTRLVVGMDSHGRPVGWVVRSP